ncbi:hypothetical protein HJG60_008478 [Phyllostomus discolor]|uniref:Uncharacterized protein n=1 Tax=Phyllostomus discolor TaxID=89673 RepID=A0A834DMA5_9CHIR|nr:hypothetical protein HJG60_008478 [Phyllostomus discolor]
MGEGRSKCALSKNKAAVATALYPLKGSVFPTNYQRPPRGPRWDLGSPPHFSPPPPTSAVGWEPGTGDGVPAAHLKHHLREIARENERHRLHRLGAAPDPESTASPALHAFSSSHIRGGGGRGLARGAAAARRGLAPPTPADREGRSRRRAPGGGGGAAGRAGLAGSPSSDRGEGRRQLRHLQFAGWRPVVPRGEGEGRRTQTATGIVSAAAFLLRRSSAGAKTGLRPLPRSGGGCLRSPGRGMGKET